MTPAQRETNPSAERSIADRAAASGGWLFMHRMTANAVRLAAVAILARRLSPAEFGVVALAQVLLQFINLVGEAGIGTYVVYDDGDGHEDRALAAFWLNFFITAAQCGVCLALLPAVGAVFNQHELAPVLGALIAVFFVQQLGVVPEALLQRKLRHPVIAKRDMVASLLSAAMSVVLALSGAGVWSLVIPSLVLEPARSLIAMVTARWWPRLPMHTSQWRRILRYTAPLMGSEVLIPVTNDGDTLLVGKVFGAATVGYYNLAWQLSNLVGRNVTSVVTVVTMPALALLRDDLGRLQAGYLRIVRFLGYTCLPLLTGMAVLGSDLVPAVYGPRWGPVVTLFRVFVAFTLVRTLTSPSSMVYNVTGRPGIGFRVTVWVTVAYVIAIVAGSEWGAVGVATAVVLVRTAGALAELRLACREIDLRLEDVSRVLARPAALTALMAAVVWSARSLAVAAGVDQIARLLSAATIGAAVYVVAILVRKPEGYDDVVRALRLARSSFRRQPVPESGEQ